MKDFSTLFIDDLCVDENCGVSMWERCCSTM